MEGGGSIGFATKCGIGRMAKVKSESGLQLLAFFTAKPQVATRYNILVTILAASAGNRFPLGYFLTWCLVLHVILRTFLLVWVTRRIWPFRELALAELGSGRGLSVDRSGLYQYRMTFSVSRLRNVATHMIEVMTFNFPFYQPPFDLT